MAATAMEQLARVAVAQIVRNSGFEYVNSTAMNVLVDVFQHWLERIGSNTMEIVELAGRTEPCFSDLILCLEEMIPVSMNLEQLIQSINDQIYHIPFAVDVPAPLSDAVISAEGQEDNVGSLLFEDSFEPLPAHIPSFLPRFPARYTYSSEKKTVVSREGEGEGLQADILKQNYQTQNALSAIYEVVSAPEVASSLASRRHGRDECMLWQSSKRSKIAAAVENVGACSERVELVQSVKNPFTVAPRRQDERLFLSSRPFRPVSSSTSKGRLHSTTNNSYQMLQNDDLSKEEKMLAGRYHNDDSD